MDMSSNFSLLGKGEWQSRKISLPLLHLLGVGLHYSKYPGPFREGEAKEPINVNCDHLAEHFVDYG